MIRVYLSGNSIHDRVLKAFAEGCNGQLVSGWDYQPSEVAVVFGVYKSRIRASWPRGKIIEQQRKNNLDVIVLETGYINRGDGENHHYAAGWNGLNGRADFKNKDMTYERWRMLNTALRPYSPGKNVILCAQVPWDASVDHHDHLKWVKTTASQIKKLTNRRCVFRPHPLAGDAVPVPYDWEVSDLPLDEELKDAHAVVTFNSNSAVEALVYGKPVWAFDEGSMVWNVCNRSLLNLETPEYHRRERWAHDLAYAQWTLDEMKQGLAWKHLSR